jgi:hypothetical protein
MAGAADPAFVAANPSAAPHTMSWQPLVTMLPHDPVAEHVRDLLPVCPDPQAIFAGCPGLVVGNPPFVEHSISLQPLVTIPSQDPLVEHFRDLVPVCPAPQGRDVVAPRDVAE